MKFIFTKEVEQRMGKYESGHHVGVGKVALEMYRNLGLLEKPNKKDSQNKPSYHSIPHDTVHLDQHHRGDGL